VTWGLRLSSRLIQRGSPTPVGPPRWRMAALSHGNAANASHQARPSRRISRRGRCRRNADAQRSQIGHLVLFDLDSTSHSSPRLLLWHDAAVRRQLSNLVRCGRRRFLAETPAPRCKTGPLGTPDRSDRSDRGQGLSVAQRGGEALDDRCRRLHFGNRTHALAGVHRHRLDVALHARERQVGRVTRYAAGNLLTLLWALA
jgi:hypothetical protein